MTMNTLCRRKRTAFLFSAPAILFLAGNSWAQPTSSSDPADDQSTTKLEKFVVTGSNIPTAGESPANPVTVLGTIDLERTGVTSDILQILRKTSPQFSGNGNIGMENGNIASESTNGGAQLALRNASTLVLVNGRRVASSPIGASGGDVFVDVNAIPVSAIERIEVLTDGASAIYGSDAVSGVVNIILKSDYRGAELGSRYGFADNDGHYTERSLWGVAGGKIGAKGPNVTASFEWMKSDPIFNSQRPYSTPNYGTSTYPGVIQLGAFDSSGNFSGDSNQYYSLDPSLTAPKAGTPGSAVTTRGYTGPVGADLIQRGFDLGPYITQLIYNEKKIGTIDFDQKINDDFSLFGNFIISRTQTESLANGQPLLEFLTADDPANPLGVDLRVNNRPVTHPRGYTANTDSYRGVLGAKGNFTSHWSWETALDYNYIHQQFINSNLVRSAVFDDGVASGAINLFDRNLGTLPDNLFGSAEGDYGSTLTTFDAKVIGSEILTLPGGGVSVAVGMEYRRESLKATSDADSQSATFAYEDGTTIDPFSEKRRVWSTFAEAQIPIVGEPNRVPGVYDARVILAVRHENYSDTSDPTVPKYTLSYSPIESIKLRGTYSQSFAAPSLFELHLPNQFGYTSNLAAYNGLQAFEELTPTAGLAPSRSKEFNYGIVWTPPAVHELSISLDFFRIKQQDVVSGLSAAGVVDQVFADVDALGASSQFAKFIHVGDYTGPTITTPGQITQSGVDNIYLVVPGASNIGTQEIKGFDLKVTYVLTLGKAGRLTFDSSSTYYSQYDIQAVAGAPFTPTAGLVTSLNGTIPRWKAYTSLTYEHENFSATLANTFDPSTKDANWNAYYASIGYPEREPSYSAFDLNLSYTISGHKAWFRGLKLEGGVNNLTNRLPPRSATFDTNSNADIGEFSPIGRFLYAQATYKF